MAITEINVRTIGVWWYGPLVGPFTASKMKQLVEDEIERDAEDLCGLYQIYGNHPVFGRKSLLYIGQSWEQSLYERVIQHWFVKDEDFHEIEIYIGLLGGVKDSQPSRQDYWKKLIDIAEMLLICAHKPPFNRKHIEDVNNICKRHRVFNYGQRADVLMEVSYERMSEEFDDWEDWE